jgi:uncharacterized protein YndB with AHSA1/START domain
MSHGQRIDKASIMISATQREVYEAFIHPKAYESWLPPQDMTGQLLEFDPQPGGAFRMKLTYNDQGYAHAGKTTEEADIAKGYFRELKPHELIVQAITFESDDQRFAGEMTMTWKIYPNNGGTMVSVECIGVPEGIGQEDHEMGLNASLRNLELYCEMQAGRRV